ncbi:MAG: hypothetical protein JWN04_3858, partial [Myxococcaceae bacterium]|nr:hypothetical protein [Myxococcaceae bacterium]
PAWPGWRGMFHAAVAGKHLTGGDLNELNRKLVWGNHYNYGSEFVRYLVQTYGEWRLWKLIERQGQSFFYPVMVNQRFRRIYGKKLSHLIDEFGDYLEQAYPVRQRPQNQRRVRQVGMAGRYARAADGSEALVSGAMDEPPTLSVYAADGSVRYSARLIDVLPKRKLVQPDPRLVSGLRFSRDGRKLYLVVNDRGLVFEEGRLLELDLATRKLSQLVENLNGFGGDISPDGKTYLFVRTTGGGQALSTLDLVSGQTRELARMPVRTYLTNPAFSPDGRQIVASLVDSSYSIALFDAQTGERTSTLTDPAGPLSDASWIDDDQLLTLGKYQERFQVFVYRLSTRSVKRISDAPYMAFQPRASGSTVRFFNREGYGYTLDEIPLEPPVAAAAREHTFAPRVLADAHEVDAAVPAAPAADLTRPADAAAPTEPPPVVQAPPDGAPPAAGLGEQGPTLDFSGAVLAPAAVEPIELTPGPVVSSGDLRLQVTPGSAPVRPPLTSVLREIHDQPYVVFPRLLIPSVREPLLGASSAVGPNTVGLYLGGTDALGKHRWGGSGTVQWNTGLLSGSVGYLNAQLSPLLLMINASQSDYDDQTYKKDASRSRGYRVEHDRSRQRDLTLTSLLTLRTSQLALLLHSTNDRRFDTPDALQRERTMSGASLLFTHRALESTPMSGPRRGYLSNLAGSYYPASLGTLRSDVADLRAELQLYSPLPLSRRHTLNLGLRARSVLDGSGTGKLLELGGTQGSSTLLGVPDKPSSRDLTPGVAPNRRFRESLRGFETLPFTAAQVGIFDLTYRLPIIVDSGTATSFAVLPAFFFRQFDLEAFASGAAESVHRLQSAGHLALGGSLAATFVFFHIELILRYQLAQRFTDGRTLQHLISLGTPLNL